MSAKKSAGVFSEHRIVKCTLPSIANAHISRCSVLSVSQTRYPAVSCGMYSRLVSNCAFPLRNRLQRLPYATIFTYSSKRLHVHRKIPWRLSRHQKYRQRERLRHVDTVIATLDNALARQGKSMKKVERWKMEMPIEQEMLPKDKYTVFDRKVKRYRKGIHSTCGRIGFD